MQSQILFLIIFKSKHKYNFSGLTLQLIAIGKKRFHQDKNLNFRSGKIFLVLFLLLVQVYKYKSNIELKITAL